MGQFIPHWLTKQAFLAPNKPALELQDQPIMTYQELMFRSKKFARQLANYCDCRIDNKKVAILSPNSIDMFIAIHALSYLDVIVVLLNTRLTKDELHFQIDNADVDVVLSTASLIEEKQIVASQSVVTFEEAFKRKELDTHLAEELKLSKPFTMMFTSGTTGQPKMVVHTYGNYWWSAMGSALNLGLHRDDKWLLTLPLFHVGGLSIMVRSVIYGTTVYLLDKYDKDVVHHVLLTEKITIASLVTLMLRQLVDELEDTTYPQTLRCLLLGGGSIPEDLLQRIKEKGLPVFQSYGMTETTSQIATLSADDALRKLGSSGKPLFPAQLKIDTKDNDKIGEIIVKGPMVISGYYQNRHATKESFIDGWLKTGDLGYVDQDGFLYVVDRRKDLIISGGENIYPSEVEDGLMQIKGIEEAAVIGKPDKRWGQVPVAFINKNQQNLTSQQILSELGQFVATYKLPKELYFVDSLPRNASNKIMRHKLSDRLT